ncbi:hypothetical protein L1887_35497 [Cichorium endivia]|nr:hypothetical protein L1887_35497 [Cichorium endivia]
MDNLGKGHKPRNLLIRSRLWSLGGGIATVHQRILFLDSSADNHCHNSISSSLFSSILPPIQFAEKHQPFFQSPITSLV